MEEEEKKIAVTPTKILQIRNIRIMDLCDEMKHCKDQNCKKAHPVWAANICIKAAKGLDHNGCGYDTSEHTSFSSISSLSELQLKAMNICLKTFKTLEQYEPIVEQVRLSNSNENRSTQISNRKPITFNEISKIRGFVPIPKWTQQTEKLIKEYDEILLHQAQQRMAEFLKKGSELNILFITDITGSMKPWIEQMKKNIIQISEFVESKFYSKSKFGFLGYKDIKDQEQFKEKNFCSAKDVKEFLEKVQVGGGGDEAEDVDGALKQAQKFAFTKTGQNICFLIADAPTHGKQYYEEKHKIGDDQAKLIIENSFEKTVQKFKEISNLTIICFKLNDRTDKMYKIMKQNYQKVFVTEKISPEQFLPTITEHVTQTLTRNGMWYKDYKQQNIQDEFITVGARRIIYRISEIPENIDSYINFLADFYQRTNISEKVVELKISKKEYESAGAQSRVFKAVENNFKNIIVKIPNSENSHDQNQVKQYVENRVKVQLLACIISKLFRQQCKQVDFNNAPPIFYLQPIVYEILNEETAFGCKYLYGEALIKIEGAQWKKYFGNFMTQINEHYPYIESFSHFSYSVSQNEILISDMQGQNYILSDPAIHTVHQDSETFYINESTNLGKDGIASFFQTTHTKCNDLCKKLKLQRTQLESELPYNEVKLNFGSKVIIICDVCHQFQQIQQNEYQQKLELLNSYLELKGSIICDSCKICIEQKENQGCQKCDSCSKPYFVNLYLKKCQERDNICPDCNKIINIYCILCRNEAYCKVSSCLKHQIVKSITVTETKVIQICPSCQDKEKYFELLCENSDCSKPFKINCYSTEFFQTMAYYQKFICSSCEHQLINEPIQCLGCKKKFSKFEFFMKSRLSKPYCDKCLEKNQKQINTKGLMEKSGITKFNSEQERIIHELIESNKENKTRLCPYCGEVYEKEEDTCDNFKCYKCQKNFCFECGCKMSPVHAHGNQYHRQKCFHYRPCAFKEDKVKLNECEECKKIQSVCFRPKCLIQDVFPPELDGFF